MPDGPDQTGLLRDFLAARDSPCPSCGYNLRGLASDRCPECNEALALQVGMLEPRLGWYLAALSGFMTGAGGALVVVCFVIYGTLRWGSPGGRDAAAIYVVPGTALLVFGAAVFAMTRVTGRIWFRRLTARERVWMIVAGWALIGVFIAWIAVWMN